MQTTVLFLILAICLSIGTNHFLIERLRITGPSMSPTLTDKQKIFINKWAYRLKKPQQSHIVAIIKQNNLFKKEYYIKRIIALPGDVVQIKQGAVYVNNQRLIEPYLTHQTSRAGRAIKKTKLSPTEYFVLGDNRSNSLDSRDLNFMTVHQKNIVGQIITSKQRNHR